jgi:protein involved in polysaccharide export with SLBB domain
MRRRILPNALGLLASGLLLWTAGCAHSTPVTAPDIATNPLPPVELQAYRLQVGDSLAVKFWGNPELDEELIIRPDGRISLPFIDEVTAAGLTPSELDASLTSLYADELKNPQITVIVREVRGQRVYVGGEVGAPRAVELNGKLTLTQALTEAEYMLPTARRKDVVVIRTMPNGERWARMIDLRPVISGEDVTNDILLQSSDLIIVPRTRIASANQWMEQYFRDLLPIRFVATFDLYEALTD